jgi:nicotinamide riboside kinase
MLAYSVWLKSYNDIYQKGIQHIKQYPYDIIFYIPPEINIINDNLRHIDKDFQYLIDTRIKKYLEEIKQYNKNIKILTISWTKLERLTQVKKILDKYI